MHTWHFSHFYADVYSKNERKIVVFGNNEKSNGLSLDNEAIKIIILKNIND